MEIENIKPPTQRRYGMIHLTQLELTVSADMIALKIEAIEEGGAISA
jgi:hypothetical protein